MIEVLRCTVNNKPVEVGIDPRESLADVLREAFAIARSGRPGPVLVDIAKNVTAAEADY